MAELSIEVPPFQVYVSKVDWPNDAIDPHKLPEYGTWKIEKRLQVLDIFKASSIVGHSYAKLKLVSGVPFETQVDPENAEKVLGLGDRVAIGYVDKTATGGIRWLFAGYSTVAALLIDNKAESVTYKIAGPEWIWGDKSEGAGAFRQIVGQVRRTSSADDVVLNGNSAPTPRKQLILCSDVPAVFNPGGRRNMTTDYVIVSDAGQAKVLGCVWEEPDRAVGNTFQSYFWNAREAVKSIFHLFNDPKITAIYGPKDWSTVAIAEEVIKEIEIDGVGPYEAIRRVCGHRWGFFIDPRPQTITGNRWDGFALKFFSRTTGAAANLVLNPRGVTMQKASASITRLEMAKDATKVVNRVHVGGRYVRHIRLIYWGGRTTKLSDKLKRTALQQGWLKSVGDLSDYKADDKTQSGGGGTDVVDKDAVNLITIQSKGNSVWKTWRDRYTTTGADFLKYKNVFRDFIWNEANEYHNGVTDYGAWYAPNLDGIADTPETPKQWTRRRRPMLDTAFNDPTSPDKWRRVKPTLWIAAAASPDDASFNTLKWHKVPDSDFEFDPMRARITFTVEDLAQWMPLKLHPEELTTGDGDPMPNDTRTFATLLVQGKLRLCLEGSVVVDGAMFATGEVTPLSGLPIAREVFIRANQNFVTGLKYEDGFSSPSGLTAASVDMKPDAQKYADSMRDAGQEQRVNSSIMVAGDWPEQKIGTMINELQGREIALQSRNSPRGAQVVAVRLDVTSFSWELLTESAAMALKERDRRRFSSGTRIYQSDSDSERRKVF